MNASSIKLGLGFYTALFIVFLYGPLAVLAILSFQTGPEGGPQFPIIEWSTYWYMPAAPSRNGPKITTISGHTHRSDTGPRQAMPGSSPQQAPTRRTMKASRWSRLLKPRHLAYPKPPRL